VAEANDQLRAARQRTASLTSPDMGLSRQELAELVNTWAWNHHGKMLEHSANWVGQLERGKIRWPGKVSREALRAILGASTDAALGFVNARSARAAVKLEHVDRKRFLRASVSVGVLAALGPLAALLESSEPTPIPHRIGATDIEQIRTATRVVESWGDTYGGGGLARETAMGQLRWSAGLLEATCPDRLRPELHSALGDLAKVAGYLAEDAGAHEARQVYHFALACAEKAGNWPLRGEILSSMAKQAIRTGQPDDGLTLAEQGLVRPDRLTATGRSMLHTDRGRALAKMRRVNETLTAIGTADDHFAHFTPDNEPPFLAFYNPARHALLTGATLADLAVLGRDPGEATDRLAAAAAGHTAEYARAGVLCRTKLASLTMATGDPLQAATIGHAALDDAGALRSRRVIDELRELAGYAAAHQHLDEVAHLRQRIATLVCTDSP
jgi:hypothetical protein